MKSGIVIALTLAFALVGAPASATVITLGVSTGNDVQLKGLGPGDNVELQLGLCVNSTFTGVCMVAGAEASSNGTVGPYTISTVPDGTRPILHFEGTTDGFDHYSLMPSPTGLLFTWGPGGSLLTGIINLFTAKQDEREGADYHFPLLMSGDFMVTGGSLMHTFDPGGADILISVAGNQRIAGSMGIVGTTNAYSGMSIQGGSISVVPEPGTLSLLAVGLIGFGLTRRRRRTA